MSENSKDIYGCEVLGSFIQLIKIIGLFFLIYSAIFPNRFLNTVEGISRCKISGIFTNVSI